MWEEDNSISVISRKAKALLSVEGTKIKFRWPKKGVYEGTIVDSSGMVKQRSKIIISVLLDSKKDMEAKAKELAEENAEEEEGYYIWPEELQ